eukprot:c14003_g1_i1.p1 GENE.c14003_g1_i1~~c14003_g1_i1.p1  ORF type:complete len:406 (-),score=66.01 c14003_g1_i1:48-1265(-)
MSQDVLQSDSTLPKLFGEIGANRSPLGFRPPSPDYAHSSRRSFNSFLPSHSDSSVLPRLEPSSSSWSSQYHQTIPQTSPPYPSFFHHASSPSSPLHNQHTIEPPQHAAHPASIFTPTQLASLRQLFRIAIEDHVLSHRDSPLAYILAAQTPQTPGYPTMFHSTLPNPPIPTHTQDVYVQPPVHPSVMSDVRNLPQSFRGIPPLEQPSNYPYFQNSLEQDEDLEDDNPRVLTAAEKKLVRHTIEEHWRNGEFPCPKDVKYSELNHLAHIAANKILASKTVFSPTLLKARIKKQINRALTNKRRHKAIKANPEMRKKVVMKMKRFRAKGRDTNGDENSPSTSSSTIGLISPNPQDALSTEDQGPMADKPTRFMSLSEADGGGGVAVGGNMLFGGAGEAGVLSTDECL